MEFRWDLVWGSMPTLLTGAKLTVQLTSIAVFFGIILGTLAGIARINKGVFRAVAATYIDVIRGTPLLVQTFLVFYGLPSILQRPIPAYVAAVLALSVNSGAYVGEIVRSGSNPSIKANGKQQLPWPLTSSDHGLHYSPQAFRRILPPLGNEFIALLKDSSLVSVIALEELVRKGQLIIGRTFRPFEVWLAVALFTL